MMWLIHQSPCWIDKCKCPWVSENPWLWCGVSRTVCTSQPLSALIFSSLVHSPCRISGSSSVREITWVCCCSIHDFNHWAQFLRTFVLSLVTSAICNFLSDIFSIESGDKKMLLKHNGLQMGREAFPFTQVQSVHTCRPPAGVFALCSSAAFWLRWRRHEAMQQSSFVAVFFFFLCQFGVWGVSHR